MEFVVYLRAVPLDLGDGTDTIDVQASFATPSFRFARTILETVPNTTETVILAMRLAKEHFPSAERIEWS